MIIKIFLYILSFLRLSLTDFLVLFLELLVLPIVFSSYIFKLSFDDICLHRSILVLKGLTIEKLSIRCRIHGSLINISDKWNNVFQEQLIHSISPLLICQICHTGSFACLKCSNLIHQVSRKKSLSILWLTYWKVDSYDYRVFLDATIS